MTHMPFQTSRQKPSVLAWVGYGLLVIILIGVIKVLFLSAVIPTQRSVSLSGSNAFYGGMMGAPLVGTVTTEGRVADASDLQMIKGETAPSAAPMMAGGGNTMMLQRIIKTAELTLRVKDAPSSVEAVRAAVAAKNGFIESSSINDSGTGPRTAYVTIRIPVADFDATMTALKSLATLVLNESVHGQDVTEQFVDLDADLRNAQAEEQSYLEILKRSGSIQDTLAVTNRLADVRGRIERFTAQKRYLENRTDLATISLTLTEETRIEVPGRTWKPLEIFHQAIRDLVESLQGLVSFLIRLGVALIGLLIPIALVILLFVWIGWKIVKAILKKFTR